MIDTSKQIAESMNRQNACFMRDKDGNLPHHVACSRHVSPYKLEKLLEVNPEALEAKNKNGRTLLDLAENTATKTHPNYALIKYLEGLSKAENLPLPPVSLHCFRRGGRNGITDMGGEAAAAAPADIPAPPTFDPVGSTSAPLGNIRRMKSDPSPGPGMKTLTAAVNFATAASPSLAARFGQVKVKTEGYGRSSRRRQKLAPLAEQHQNNQHHLFQPVPETEALDDAVYGYVHDAPVSHQAYQSPGDANLLLQFARGASPTDQEQVPQTTKDIYEV